MIRLTRGPCPPILESRGSQWTAEFVASAKKRPDSRRYAHPEVVAALRSCSAGKCFVCEAAVAEGKGEVDHHVEVEHDRSRAFDWSNLFWTCDGCNRKKMAETTNPRAGCLHPFDGPDPQDHLVYDDDKVFARHGSPAGRCTISKYRLDRQDLELARSRALRELDGRIRALLLADAPRTEIDALIHAFGERDRPFSAMFRAYRL